MARQTMNKIKFVGTFVEDGLKLSKGTVGKDKIPCDILSGSIAVRVNNVVYKIDLWKASKTVNGEENKSYVQTLNFKNNAVSEISAKSNGTSPSKIEVTAELRENIYVNDQNQITTIVKLSVPMFSYPKVTASDDTCEGNFEAIVNNISPEMVNGESTGRYNVKLWGVGYGDLINEINFIVDADIADDFMDIYAKGNTAMFDITCVGIEKNVQPKRRGGFGRHANVSESYTVTEYHIIGGDDPYEEDMNNSKGEPLMFTKKEMKELMEVREMYIKNKESEGYKGGKKNKLPAEKNPFASKAATATATATATDDEDEIPF